MHCYETPGSDALAAPTGIHVITRSPWQRMGKVTKIDGIICADSNNLGRP
jgi:hypothetical protein